MGTDMSGKDKSDLEKYRESIASLVEIYKSSLPKIKTEGDFAFLRGVCAALGLLLETSVASELESLLNKYDKWNKYGEKHMCELQTVREYCEKTLENIKQMEQADGYDEDIALKFVTTAREYEIRTILGMCKRDNCEKE
jgi:hypothetical protein